MRVDIESAPTILPSGGSFQPVVGWSATEAGAPADAEAALEGAVGLAVLARGPNERDRDDKHRGERDEEQYEPERGVHGGSVPRSCLPHAAVG